MQVEVLIGPPASGKTHYLIQIIRELLMAEPLAQIHCILPNNYQVEAFQKALVSAKIYLGVKVSTMGEVYREILDIAGTPTPDTPASLISLLIRNALHELYSHGELNFYAPIHHTPGLVRALRERFRELKSRLITYDRLEEAIRGESLALQELSNVYGLYLAELRRNGWADEEGAAWLAVEVLQSNPRLLAGWQLVALDGFDEFPPAMRRALSSMASQVGDVLITLTGEQGLTRSAHQRFRRALEDLQGEMDCQVHYLNISPRLPAGLAYLERNLFEENSVGNTSTNDQFHMLEVSSYREEARESLRWIKSLIYRKGLHPGACAIFTPAPPEYHSYIKSAAQEFNLPLYIAWGEELGQTPAASVLLELLQLAEDDYPFLNTLEVLRAPFFDWERLGWKPGDPAVLEITARKMQVSGGLNRWLEALRALSNSQGDVQEDPPEDELEGNIPRLPRGREAARIAEVLQRLAERLEPPEPQNMSDWVSWFKTLLDDLGFTSRCDPPVFKALNGIIRALLLGESLQAKSDYAQFISSLHTLVTSTTYHTQWEGSRDGIFVGPISTARGLRFSAVAVMGLSEGLFPRMERLDPFLDEDLRSRLGLESSLGRDQSAMFYQAVTRASQHLLLLRPYLGEGGEPWEPSPYWEAAARLCAHPPARLRSGAPRYLSDAASASEVLFWSLRQGHPLEDDPELHARLKFARTAGRALHDFTTIPQEGDLPRINGLDMQALYDEEYVWSPSRLESYATCPYRFFIENVLHLEALEPPEPGYDAAQLGAILHAILERVFQRAANHEDIDDVLSQLPAASAEVFQIAPMSYGFHPGPLWEHQQAELIKRLESTLRELVEVSDGWIPVAYELPFGLRGAPTLDLNTSYGRVRLHGVIDRLDKNSDGTLRVIDYKTGSSRHSDKDLAEGRSLQIALYALAVRDALHLGEPSEGFYWQILSASKSPIQLSKFTTGGETGAETAMLLAEAHVGRFVDSIRKAVFPAIPPHDSCPDYCAARTWCWRYQKGSYAPGA